TMIREQQERLYEEGGYIIWGFSNQVDAYHSYVVGMQENATGLPLGGYDFALVKFLRQFSVIIFLVMRPRVLGRWCDNRSRRGSVGIHWRARWGGGGCTRTRCILESRLRLHDG